MAFEHYPYTNFHELNLDWLMGEMKHVVEEFMKLQDNFDKLQGNFDELQGNFDELHKDFGDFTANITNEFNEFKTGVNNDFTNFANEMRANMSNYQNKIDAQFAALQQYVNDYFDNLDLTTEVNNKIDQMVNDGTLMELMLPYFSYVNIKSYGANGDGATDDSAAIRKALNDNYNIYFPSGIYKMGSAVVISPTTPYKEIVGSGIIYLQDDIAITQPAFAIRTASHLLIEGLAFTGGRQSASSVGMITMLSSADVTVSNITLRDCTFYNSKRPGISIGKFERGFGKPYNIKILGCNFTSLYGGVVQSDCHVTKISMCNFANMSNIEAITIDNETNDCAVDNCVFNGTTGGIGFIGCGFTNNSIISNCKFNLNSSGASQCIGIGAALTPIQGGNQNLKIIGCSFDTNRASVQGIYIFQDLLGEGGDGAQVTIPSVIGLTIANNSFGGTFASYITMLSQNSLYVNCVGNKYADYTKILNSNFTTMVDGRICVSAVYNPTLPNFFRTSSLDFVVYLDPLIAGGAQQHVNLNASTIYSYILERHVQLHLYFSIDDKANIASISSLFNCFLFNEHFNAQVFTAIGHTGDIWIEFINGGAIKQGAWNNLANFTNGNFHCNASFVY